MKNKLLLSVAAVVLVTAFSVAGVSHAVGTVSVTFTVTPSTISPGGSSTLSWNSTNADSCSGSGTNSFNISGSWTVTPAVTTTYTVTCYNSEPPTTNKSSSKTVIVSATPAPTATISASPSSIAFGSSSTITWSSTNATSCTGANFSTGNATAGTVSVSPNTSTTYSVTCTGSGGTANQSATVTVSTVPDLTAGGITPASAYVNVAVTLSSTISNLTSASTGANFTSLFQRATDAAGSNATDIGTVNVSTLAGNANTSATLSYTFPSVATWYVRACADKNSAASSGTITESNEGNNCGPWTAITVTVPTGPVTTLVASPTTITAGQSVTLTWSSGSAIGCNGTNFQTGGASSGSVTVTPVANTTYSIYCSSEGGSGTWQYEFTDVSDYSCPLSQAKIDSTYGAVSDCPASPAGKSCTASCKINSVNGCNVNTDYYSCGSPSGTSANATVTVTACTPTGVVGEWYTGTSVFFYNEGLGNPADCSLEAQRGGYIYWNGQVTYTSGVFDPYTTICYSVPSPTGTVSKPSQQFGNTTVTYQSGQNCPVVAPAPTITASPETTVAGQSSTITWSSTNATSCTGTNFSTENASSGSVIVTPTSSTAYTVTCNGASNSVIVSVTYIDLTAGTPALASGTLVSGSPLIFQASTTNGGTAMTSTTYSNRFQIDLTADGSYDTNLDAAISTAGINAGQSKTVTAPSWSATVGTHKIRMCTDSPTSAVPESNEGNNCGPDYTFTVAAPPVPTASISASPSSIAYGGSSTLTWTSTNSTSCTGTNFSTGNAVAGSLVVSPTTNTTYTVTCTGTGGSANNSATITVAPPPVPTASLTVSPSTIISGNSSTLSWTSTNSTSCTGTNFSTGNAVSGTLTVSPTSNTTYTVTCSGAGGSANNSKTITVTLPAPVATISATPSSIVSGNSSTITWSATNATSCTGTNFSTGNAVSGSVAVSPTSNTTYSVSCTGSGGTGNNSTTVTVTAGTLDFTSGVPSVNTGNLASSTVVTFKANVTNGGTGNTSSTFSNRFQIDLSNNGSWDVTLNAPNSIAGLNSGLSKTATSPNWLAKNGTHAIRLCADTPGTITESNESNNCGSSYVFTVAAAPNAPAISGASSGVTNTSYPFSFQATDPGLNTVRYGVDWDNNGILDQYLPASGYVASGIFQDAPKTWTTNGTKTFTALTQNSLGANSSTSSKSVNISTAPPPLPTVVITVTPSSITSGQSTTIVWSSANATTCTGTGFSTGNATNGSVSSGALFATQSYSVSCTGAGGTANDSATVTVTSVVDIIAGVPGLNSGSLYAGATVTFWANATNQGTGNTATTFSNRFQVDLNNNGSWDVNLDASNSIAGLNAGQSKQATSPSWTAVIGTHKVRMCADSPSSVISETDETNNCSATYFTFTVTAVPECQDGLDNNNNGLTDYPADQYACTSAGDGSEDTLSDADLVIEAFSTGSGTVTAGLVRPKTPASLAWQASNVVAGSCTITGDNGDSWDVSGASGSQLSSELTHQTDYTLSCMDLNMKQVQVQVIVRIAPEYEER